MTDLDPEGEKVTHHRTVDTLRMMLSTHRISKPMHDAACDFGAAFNWRPSTAVNPDQQP